MADRNDHQATKHQNTSAANSANDEDDDGGFTSSNRTRNQRPITGDLHASAARQLNGSSDDPERQRDANQQYESDEERKYNIRNFHILLSNRSFKAVKFIISRLL